MTPQAAMRERALSHGLHIASANGLGAVSLGEVARELDVPRSGLFTLFASREKLQLAILDRAAVWFTADVIDPALRGGRGVTRVEALFHNWIAWARSDRLKGGCPFVHASSESKALDADIGKRLGEVLDGWRDTLRAAIIDSKGQGFRAELDTEQLIFEMFGLYLSHHFWHWSMRDREAEWRTLKAFDRLIGQARA